MFSINKKNLLFSHLFVNPVIILSCLFFIFGLSNLELKPLLKSTTFPSIKFPTNLSNIFPKYIASLHIYKSSFILKSRKYFSIRDKYLIKKV